MNLPVQALARARKITGKGITETIDEALHELERSQARQSLRALRGRVKFDLDLKGSRR